MIKINTSQSREIVITTYSPSFVNKDVSPFSEDQKGGDIREGGTRTHSLPTSSLAP